MTVILLCLCRVRVRLRVRLLNKGCDGDGGGEDEDDSEGWFKGKDSLVTVIRHGLGIAVLIISLNINQTWLRHMTYGL